MPSIIDIPMGRRRIRDFDLPPRMQRKGAALYYVTSETPRRWIPLGSDLARARSLWADLEGRTLGVTTVERLLAYFMENCGDAWSPSTRSRYAAFVATLTEAFGSRQLEALTAHELARWRDLNRHRPIWVNGCLSVLRGALAKAVEWGWCPSNPARDVANFAAPERERYLTDAEFVAIRSKAPSWLRDAMDLAYLTALRQSDVLALRWADVGDVVTVRQIKTGARQAFTVTPELRAVLERCRAKPIVGLFVIAGEKGRPIRQRKLQEAFADAVAAAKVKDARFHDIRAKGGTDAKRDGLDYQALLGHKSARTSERYIRSKETPVVQSLRRKL